MAAVNQLGFRLARFSSRGPTRGQPAIRVTGALLVVAMMIAPAVTVYLLTERLGVMLLLSVAQGVISSALGYLLARWLDSSIASAMTTVSGALFMLALLLEPRSGLMARAVARRALRRLPLH